MEKAIERYQTLIFFLVSLILSWLMWIPMALNKLNIIEFNIPIIIGQSIGGLCPLITLFVLNKVSKGAIGVKEIFDSIRIKGEKTIWLIPAALLIPLLTIGGNIFNFLIGTETQLNILKTGVLELFSYGIIGLIPLLFFVYLLSSPLFEEPCWRGYGLGKLQRKFGRELGSLLLGSYWWLWHQPINIANGLEVSFYSYLIMLSYSFITDSIYNLSNQNLLSAMFVHSSLIILSNYIYQSNNLFVLIMLFIGIFILRIFEWRIKKVNVISEQPGISTQSESSGFRQNNSNSNLK